MTDRILAAMVLLLPAFLLSACGATVGSPRVTYAGDRQPASAVGVVSGSNVGGLFGASELQVLSVDGVAVDVDNRLPNAVEVLPGRHEFEVELHSGGRTRWTRAAVDVRAGDRLEFVIAGKADAGGDPHVIVRDAATGERRQSLAGWQPAEDIDFLDCTAHCDRP